MANKKSGLRHYEVVFLVHPDQEEQMPAMVDRYKKIITDARGKIHRFEDWGRRPLAYPINDLHKAHYILMNVETSTESILELEKAFKFNDAIIRNLIMSVKKPVKAPSPMLKMKEKDERRAAYLASQQARQGAEDMLSGSSDDDSNDENYDIDEVTDKAKNTSEAEKTEAATVVA